MEYAKSRGFIFKTQQLVLVVILQVPNQLFSEETCKEDCTSHDVPCFVEKHYSDISSSFRVSGLADGWPGPPEEANFAITEILENNNHVRLNFTWSLPNDASYKKVDGFYLAVHHESGLSHFRHFSLKGTNWNDINVESSKIRFYYDCLPLFERDGLPVFIQLQSLPLPAKNHQHNKVSRFHTISLPLTASELSISTAIIRHTSPKCCHSAIAIFHHESGGQSITAYNIMLINLTENYKLVDKITFSLIRMNEATQIKQPFQDLCEGQYKIVVSPLKDGQACEECLLLKSEEFGIPSDLGCTDNTDKIDDLSIYIIVIIAATLFLLMIIIAASIIICLKKRGIRSEHSHNSSSDPDPSAICVKMDEFNNGNEVPSVKETNITTEYSALNNPANKDLEIIENISCQGGFV